MWQFGVTNEIHVEKATNPGPIALEMASKLLQFSPYSINKLALNGDVRF